MSFSLRCHRSGSLKLNRIAGYWTVSLVLLASASLLRSLFIHTYLQIGDEDGRRFREPFQRFAAALEKPFKRFQKVPYVSDTQLKQGVNEKALTKRLFTDR